MIILENQIPLCSLRRMLELRFSLPELADRRLLLMLLGFCRELSPFKMVGELCNTAQMMECAHVLDFLYQVIIQKSDESPPS